MPSAVAPSVPAVAPSVPAHLREFHSEPDDDGRPVLLSIGNCQAESLRAVLPDTVRGIRTPPVHELTADDLPPLAAWLQRADLLVTQPIRADYRGLPVGTAQLIAGLRPGARAAIVPVVRFAGLYPRHAIVRPPSDPSLTPPVVPYHDLAVLLEAAGLALGPLRPDAVLAVRDESLSQLRRREEAHGTVRASDLFAHPTFELMRTINHPGNPLWLALAARVLDALGVPDAPADPGRPLLDSIHAPRETVVIDAFGLDADPDPDWTLEGHRIPVEEVRAAHLAWYAEHPDAVAAGLERHAPVIAMLRA